MEFSMAKPAYGSKLIAFIVVAIIGAAAGFGYFKQSSALNESEAKTVKADSNVLSPRPADIIIGDVNALVTIVEYMSMSCTHCAHFHQTVMPDLTKEFITPGKVKLIVRHFPLNEPAMRGAMVVECTAQGGLDRTKFIKVLLDMQEKWAFTEDFLKNLKQISLVGGLDSAAFDSCVADKDLEARILASRKEAEEKLKVDSTPAFYINGVKFEGDRTIEGFRKGISAAEKPQK
jgi:protein-disulfide isomerase